MDIRADDYPPEQWRALGQALQARRERPPEQGGLGWPVRKDFCNPHLNPGALGISLTGYLEKGRRHPLYEADTVARIEAMYQLAPGAMARFLAGEDEVLRLADPAELERAAQEADQRTAIYQGLARLGIRRRDLATTIATLQRLHDATAPDTGPVELLPHHRRAAG